MLLNIEPTTSSRVAAALQREVQRVRVISWDQFDDQLRSRWVQLQSSNPALDSPSLRPEFAEIMAAVRPNAELAILESAGEIVGFFPYVRGWWDIAYPIGGRLSDYHGVIAPQGLIFSPVELLKACGLSGWYFDHLVGGHVAFDPHVRRVCESPYIVTKDGLKGLMAQSNSRQLKRWMQRHTKLEKEFGPLRLDLSTTDDAAFDKLLEWKSAQYQRTAVTDVFSFPWVEDALRRIWACGDQDFAGVLTALYAGDRIAAVHFGMRSKGVMQGWFPAYDVELSKHSPGAQMDLQMIDSAAIHGIDRIDMGRGVTSYKSTLSCGSFTVAEGCVSRSWVCQMAHKLWPAARDRLKQSSLRIPIGWAGRATRKLRGRIAFR